MAIGRIFSSLLFVFAGLNSCICAKDTNASLEESLELRKISEYWKEKDYNTAKIQIQNFLSKNPQSEYLDQLNAMLGDLYFQEKKYADANCAYEKIQGKEFILKSQYHRLHSLYAIGKYEEFILSSELFLNAPSAKPEQIDVIRFELAEAYFAKANAPENEKKKGELMQLALSEYETLAKSCLADQTLLPQAQIHAFLGAHAKAAALYLQLASKDLEKREDFLFQAAALQLHFDRKIAIDTFGAIADLGGKNASKAAFNHLNLLFQEKQYKEFILSQDKFLKTVPADKLALMQLYLGKSLIQTKDFARAIDPLTQSLASKALDPAQEKSALLALLSCAQQTQDLSLFEKGLSHLQKAFPTDEETSTSLLVHAAMSREKKEWGKARSDLQQLLETHPSHPQKESLLYDLALLLAEENKWQEGAKAFESFLKEYPESAHHASALRYCVSLRLEDLKHASVETQKIKQEELLTSLSWALEEAKTFSADEQQKMLFLLAKTEFDSEKYDEAILHLDQYTRDYPKDASCADAYLLLAYCYQKGSRDEIHFCLNAQKALRLNPKLSGAADLHLTLFNTFLGIASKSPLSTKAEMMESAADHLYLSMEKSISQENKRWLASYYYHRYQSGSLDAAERAGRVLEQLLGVNENSLALSIDSKSLEKEGEAIKLADLYGKTGRLKQRAELLEALVKEQGMHPELNWKYQRMAQFELGKTQLALGEKEKAASAFEALITSSSHLSSYFAIAAQIEKAKLDFSLLRGVDCYEDSEAALAICDALKNVQIQRKLHSEPLHLEAALCYVDIKSHLSSASQQVSVKKQLLEQMKTNFTAADDPLVIQYLSAAEQFPEKENLFKQYIAFIDLEIERLDAQENPHSPQLQNVKQKFDQLLSQASDDTLIQRIRLSTEELAKAL
jgi:TolA-binding protein